MSKYILYLEDKDPKNNQTIECSSGLEARDYKKKSEKMGFKVTIKREEMKNDINNINN